MIEKGIAFSVDVTFCAGFLGSDPSSKCGGSLIKLKPVQTAVDHLAMVLLSRRRQLDECCGVVSNNQLGLCGQLEVKGNIEA